jgi:hypothetical protein
MNYYVLVPIYYYYPIASPINNSLNNLTIDTTIDFPQNKQLPISSPSPGFSPKKSSPPGVSPKKSSPPGFSPKNKDLQKSNNTELSPKKHLPCINNVATGFCPYYERCDFIHDERCINKKNYNNEYKKHITNSLKLDKDKENDLFFYPQLNNYKKNYELNLNESSKIYYREVSMWNHFILYLRNNNSNMFLKSNKNIYGKNRLDIFIQLSK